MLGRISSFRSQKERAKITFNKVYIRQDTANLRILTGGVSSAVDKPRVGRWGGRRRGPGKPGQHKKASGGFAAGHGNWEEGDKADRCMGKRRLPLPSSGPQAGAFSEREYLLSLLRLPMPRKEFAVVSHWQAGSPPLPPPQAGIRLSGTKKGAGVLSAPPAWRKNPAAAGHLP